jgi:hypothetical protein
MGRIVMVFMLMAVLIVASPFLLASGCVLMTDLGVRGAVHAVSPQPVPVRR